MAKSTTQSSETPESTEVASSAAQVAGQSAVQITLIEFMQRLSQRDKRVELINAFNYTERQAGHIKDFESNFQSRFVAFTQLVIED